MSKHKIMLPILAAIVGVAASAFTVANQRISKTVDEYYWFQYSSDGQTLLNQSDRPEKMQSDPFACSGGLINCSQAFTTIDSTTEGGQKVYTPGTPASPTLIETKN